MYLYSGYNPFTKYHLHPSNDFQVELLQLQTIQIWTRSQSFPHPKECLGIVPNCQPEW